VDFERPFDLFSLLESFDSSKIVYPDVLPVIMSMLQNGLKDVLRHQDDPESPLSGRDATSRDQIPSLSVPAPSNRRRSMSLTKDLEMRRKFYRPTTIVKILTEIRNVSAPERTDWGPSSGAAHCNTVFGRHTLEIFRIQGLRRVIGLYEAPAHGFVPSCSQHGRR
jgi:hypothetical protein